jgi:hypothetical protein
MLGHANEVLGIYDCGTTIEADGSIFIGLNRYSYEKTDEVYSTSSSKIRMYADNSLFDEGVIGVVEVFKDGGYRFYIDGLGIETPEYWCVSNFYDHFRFPSTAIYPDSLNGHYLGPMGSLDFSGTPPDYLKQGNYCVLTTNPLGIELTITSASGGNSQRIKTFIFQTYDRNEILKDGESYTLFDRNPLIDEENASSLEILIIGKNSVYIRVEGDGSYVDLLEPYFIARWGFSCDLIKQ